MEVSSIPASYWPMAGLTAGPVQPWLQALRVPFRQRPWRTFLFYTATFQRKNTRIITAWVATCGDLGFSAVLTVGDGAASLTLVRSFSKQTPPAQIWSHLWPRLCQSEPPRINLFKRRKLVWVRLLVLEYSFILEGVWQKGKQPCSHQSCSQLG